MAANSSTSTGLEWQTVSAGSLTLLSTTTFNDTVATYTISSISGSYKNLRIVGTNLQGATTGASDTIRFRFNGDTGNNYSMAGEANVAGTPTAIGSRQNSSLFTTGSGATVLGRTGDSSGDFGYFDMTVFNYASSTERKNAVFMGGSNNGFSARHYTYTGLWNDTSAITSLTFLATDNFKSGVIRIYGEN